MEGVGAAAAPATDVDDSVSLARITAGDSAAKSYKEVVKLWRGKSRCAKSTTTPPAAALWIQHRTRLFLSFPDDLMQKKKKNLTSLCFCFFCCVFVCVWLILSRVDCRN